MVEIDCVVKSEAQVLLALAWFLVANDFQNAKKGIPVVIQVSTNGIKVFDEKETVSALSKISLALELDSKIQSY